MSRPKRSAIPLGPKIVFGVSTVATLGAIFYSHYSQVRDKEAMKEGVRRDKERIKMKRLMKKRQQMEKDQTQISPAQTDVVDREQ